MILLVSWVGYHLFSQVSTSELGVVFLQFEVLSNCDNFPVCQNGERRLDSIYFNRDYFLLTMGDPPQKSFISNKKEEFSLYLDHVKKTGEYQTLQSSPPHLSPASFENWTLKSKEPCFLGMCEVYQFQHMGQTFDVGLSSQGDLFSEIYQNQQESQDPLTLTVHSLAPRKVIVFLRAWKDSTHLVTSKKMIAVKKMEIRESAFDLPEGYGISQKIISSALPKKLRELMMRKQGVQVVNAVAENPIVASPQKSPVLQADPKLYPVEVNHKNPIFMDENSTPTQK